MTNLTPTASFTSNTPRVDVLIAQVIARHPADQPEALAPFYEAIYQELTTLARQLESENRLLRQQADGVQPAKPHQRLLDCTIGSDDAYIICNACGSTSHHPEDIAQRYCGRCNKFHTR